jgi:hypothetical protein
MLFLSHRGLWKNKTEQNTLAAFNSAFENGFGCELDVRDRDGELVISHDVPQQSCLLLEEVFQNYQKLNCQQPIAINIKADGLQVLLKELILSYKITNYFTFDMSIPDTLGYQRNEIVFFSRQSEYEPEPIFYEKAGGIWLDAFNEDWWSREELIKHLENNKVIAVVSPELHRREHLKVWHILASINHNRLMLCTDFPEAAREFFNA